MFKLSGTFQTEQMVWKCPQKLPENPKIVKSLKFKPFNRTFGKFQQENRMQRKFSIQNGVYLARLPSFPEISVIQNK